MIDYKESKDVFVGSTVYYGKKVDPDDMYYTLFHDAAYAKNVKGAELESAYRNTRLLVSVILNDAEVILLPDHMMLDTEGVVVGWGSGDDAIACKADN